MYDGWTSLLSEELLAQAVRVDGILYLPAYDLAGELLRLVVPIWVASCILVAWVVFCFIACRLMSVLDPKKSQG